MLISDICIRRPVLAIVLNLLLALLGIYGFEQLGIRQLPAMELPNIVVDTVLAGASPEQVERQVTFPIEAAVASAPGIDQVTSQSRAGHSLVNIRFKPGQNGTALANEIRNKVAAVRGQLPASAESPVVTQQSLDAMPIVYFAVASTSHDAMEVSALVKRLLVPQIAAIDGVAQAQMLGERRYAIRILLDPIKLAAYGLTVDDVAGALAAQNADLPGGEIRSATDRMNVQVVGSLASPEQFASLVLRNVKGYLVRVGDVGEVRITPESMETAMRYNGRDVVAIGVVPQSTANPLDIAKAVKAQMPRLQQALPGGVTIALAFDSTVFIESSVHEVFETIVIAIVLVLAVILLFLGSLRSSAIALVTIPLSLLGTLGFMWMMGFSINTFTLLAIVLAIGLVVDDAIVEIENVQRHVDCGLGPIAAAFLGSREIGFAVIATTLTLAAVFAPIALVGGQIGMLFREFALSLAVAVVISGYIARTLSPMMCSRLIRAHAMHGPSAVVDAAVTRLAERYHRAVTACLRRRWLVGAGVGIGVAVGVLAGARLDVQFAPAEDDGFIMFDIEAQPTATLDYLQAHIPEVERILKTVPEAKGALMLLGSPKPNHATGYLMLAPWNQRSRSAQQISGALLGPLAEIAGLRVSVLSTNFLGGAGSGAASLVVKTTAGYDELAGAMQLLAEKARHLPQLLQPLSTLELDKPEISITIDRDLAGDQGVSAATLGNTLRTLLGGNPVSTFTSEGELYKVILDMPDDWKGRTETINSIRVRTNTGEMMSLQDFVRIERTAGADTLEHTDGLRSATLVAGVAPGTSPAQGLALLRRIAAETLPANMRASAGGDAGTAEKQGGSVAVVFGLALAFIILMLSAQFESFRDPAIILSMLPLTLAGALVSLAVSGGSLNLYSFIGLITLVGLIAKHGILITEFANQLRDQGRARAEAVAEAAATRLRPIVMTTAATVLGAMPLALATGAGANSRSQLGWVIVGGMAFGTLVSLFVVPTVYTLLSPRAARRLVEIPVAAQ
jgi:multidrug efflux pump